MVSNVYVSVRLWGVYPFTPVLRLILRVTSSLISRTSTKSYPDRTIVNWESVTSNGMSHINRRHGLFLLYKECGKVVQSTLRCSH